MMKETANKNPMFNVCLYRCRRAAAFPNEEKPTFNDKQEKSVSCSQTECVFYAPGLQENEKEMH